MSVFRVTRRRLLSGASGLGALAGATGLWLGIAAPAKAAPASRRGKTLSPKAFLSLDRHGIVTVWIIRSEMGQGVSTALPMLVAEELDADFSRLRLEHGTVGLAQDFGSQFTAASSSMGKDWTPFRQAGAMARDMLLSAAAQKWGVAKAECITQPGESRVRHPPSGKSASYGALAELAAAQTPPKDVKLKDPGAFRLLGTPAPRLDLPDKVTGRAQFGLDVRVDGMLHAVIARCPTFGGNLRCFDARAARAVRGVVDVVRVQSGLAVVAEHTHAALRGRQALQIEWDLGPHGNLSSEAISRALDAGLAAPGAVAHRKGDTAPPFAKAGAIAEARYQLPYLAHATMEPMNCVAHVFAGRCEVWAPTQHPDGVRDLAAQVAGLPPDKVVVRKTYMGGGFGRRTNMDEVSEAVELSRKLGKPIQIVWSREDDLQNAKYREASAHHVRAPVDREGYPTAWWHHLATTTPDLPPPGEFNHIACMGAEVPYAIDHVRVEWTGVAAPVPVTIWRSVGHSHNTFVMESFIDELAARATKDPLEYRRRLLRNNPRLWHCVERAAARADWPGRRKAKRMLGMAAAHCFGSYVAQVAEVTIAPDGQLSVPRVWCVVDCGLTVNPDTIAAQMEGGIIFGLTATLHGNLTVEHGAIAEGNFDTYPLLRMYETPEIAVEIVKSGEKRGGIGEVGVPTLAPAVANAVFAATGRRLRRMPLRLPG